MVDKSLEDADLVVDEVYGGSRNGNASDDPLPSLIGVDNGAGFRHLGQRPHVSTLRLISLKTSFSDVNWPDSLDRERGLFTYYGDNHGARELHDTPRQGNLILRNLFDEAHNAQCSSHFPPIVLFGNTGTYRDVRFLGLAVPGAEGMGSDNDLVAVWRTSKDGSRFQNYKAILTVLDIPSVSRAWINDIKLGKIMESPHVPAPWLDRCVWQLVLAHLWKLTLAHLWKLTGPDGDAMCPGLKRSESPGHIACDQSTCFLAPAFLHRAPEAVAVRAGLDDVCPVRDAIQQCLA